jgi:hypothetical protein
MNCFNHRDRQAIAICKACGKGLCPDCIIEISGSVACKDICEKRVTVLNNLLDAQLRLISLARLFYVLPLVFGILLVIWGLLCIFVGNTSDSHFPLIVGLFFVLFSIGPAAKSRKLRKLD